MSSVVLPFSISVLPVFAAGVVPPPTLRGIPTSTSIILSPVSVSPLSVVIALISPIVAISTPMITLSTLDVSWFAHFRCFNYVLLCLLLQLLPSVLVPELGDRVAKIYFDPPFVNESTVHFTVGQNALILCLKLDKRILKRVSCFPVSDYFAGGNLPEP